jgi:hypothetical protein
LSPFGLWAEVSPVGAKAKGKTAKAERYKKLYDVNFIDSLINSKDVIWV